LDLRACDLCLPNHRLIHFGGLRNPDTGKEINSYRFRPKARGDPERIVQQKERVLNKGDPEVSRTDLARRKPSSSAYMQQI